MDTAMLAAWTTPSASDGERGGTITANMTGSSLAQQARLAPWATPAARDYRHANAKPFSERGGGKKGEQLCNQVVHLVGSPDRLTASGEAPSGYHAETAGSGQLNPALARWLQGLPPVWCASAVTAMQSMRRSRRSSSGKQPGSSEIVESSSNAAGE